MSLSSIFGLGGGDKKPEEFKLSGAQLKLKKQQEQIAKLANERAISMLGGVDADRQRAEEASYGSLSTRLRPEFDRRRTRLENRLWGQGIAPTNDAYKREISDFDRSENDAWMEAARQSVAAGQQSQNSTFNNVASLFGVGQPNIDLPLSVWQANNMSGGSPSSGTSPLTKGLFKLGSTALSSWLSSR